jgi:hypothetical protein
MSGTAADFTVEPKTELEPWAREALDEQEAAPREHEGASDTDAADHESSHAAHILVMVDVLEPGDHKHLAQLLKNHPELHEAILAKAQGVCGNATVVKALELLAGPPQTAGGADHEAAADSDAAQVSPDKAADAVVNAKKGDAAEKEFVYILSPLALEYDRNEKIVDHVDFIHKNPELRDHVLTGAAEFDADLARDVAKALRGEAPPSETASPAPTAAPSAEHTPEPSPAPAEEFVYITSFLALEYNYEDKIKDHVDFILENPHLRDDVLIGTAEFDQELAEEVRSRLKNPEPEPALPEEEPTPAEVVAKDAAQAAPTPVPAQSHAPKKEEASDAATEKHDKPEAGWVVRARAYNAKHADLVAIFNDATGYVCLDADGRLDPNLVATWQVQNGVSPDGRVGDQTVTAAILALPVDEPVAVQAEEAAEESTDPPG